MIPAGQAVGAGGAALAQAISGIEVTQAPGPLRGGTQSLEQEVRRSWPGLGLRWTSFYGEGSSDRLAGGRGGQGYSRC